MIVRAPLFGRGDVPLVLTSRLQGTEALLGYLLRLATLNQTRGIAPLLKAAGLKPSWKQAVNFGTTAPDLTELGRLAGLSRSTLQASGYWRTAEGPWHTFNQHLIRLTDLSLAQARVCPQCLGDREVCWDVWDLRAYPCCHVHRCRLLSACPQCNRPIGWSRPSVGHCRCGFDLAQAVTPPASIGVVVIAKMFNELARGRPAGLVPTEDLQSLIRLVQILGSPVDRPLSMRAIQREHVEAAYDGGERAADYLHAWPFGFKKWLAARCAEKPGVSLARDFGGVLQQLRDAFSPPAGNFVLDVVRNYIADEWRGLPAANTFFAAGEKAKYVSYIKAARSLGVDTKFILRLLEQGRIKGLVRKRGQRRAILIEVSSLPAAEAARRSLLLRSEVAARLAVTELMTLKMRKAGLITAIDEGPRVYFLSAEIDAFLVKIGSLAQPFADQPLVPIPRLSTRHRSFVDFIRDILAAEISIFHLPVPGEGLGAFGVSPSDIYRGKTRIDGRVYLTLKQAAKTLHLAPRQLEHMQKLGLIPRHGYKHPFTPETVEMARAEFMRSWEIGDELGLGFRRARAWIDATGVRPVIEHDPAAGVCAMWRTRDVERVIGHPLKRARECRQRGYTPPKERGGHIVRRGRPPAAVPQM